MHNKQVRRRRAVLAVLVGISLILLTAYFGEPSTSPLHSLQRGIVEVFSPVQEGASKVFSPIRDVGNWFSDTIHAKSQASQLKKQNSILKAKLAQAEAAESLNAQLRKEVGLDQTDNVSSYTPVAGDVIAQDPTLWYQQIEVDKGSDDGVAVDDAVVGDGALVGKVVDVGSTYSIVSLITDHTVNVTAQVNDRHSDRGLLVPKVGNPNELLLEDLPTLTPGQPGPQYGQQVLTAGFKSGGLTSLYPRGILIGTVSKVNANALYSSQQIQVSPAADLKHLQAVQILTHTQGSGNARAQVP